MTPNRPLRLFISYSHRDERYRREMETHLAGLQREGILEVWSDRQIDAGQEWCPEIRRNLETADLILLLVSPAFLASAFCCETELRRAMARHAAGEASVIPVFVRPCDWTGAPFGTLQGVPDPAKPIAQWRHRDQAFTRVAQTVRKAAASLPPERPAPLGLIRQWGLRAGRGSRSARRSPSALALC